MNSTNLSHAALALACQVVIAAVAWLAGVPLFPAFVMGGLLAVGFYWGREVAQAEAKAGGDPWWIGFDIRLWGTDAKYDLLMPVVVCGASIAVAAVFAS